ncbi:MAG: secretin N-terminal domain-containing protein [Elusimicrobiota bacterium]|nr:secretin N-terminal domain-containing protein [Elusimicrobiota bacterium]
MKMLKILLAFMLAFEQLLFPVALLFAQDAPAGDKDFAQDLQGPGGEEGGPILDGGSDSPPPSVMPQGQVPGSPIESVQIGGAPKDAPMYEDVESVSPLDRKIGPIRLKGAPLSTFLDVVSAQSKVNFIITEGLEAKTITVFLRKTTVREALELLLRVKGLTYQRIGKSNTYVVQKRSVDMPNLITKIYTLNYIPLIPISSVGEEIASITAQDSSSGGQQSGGQSGGQGGGGGGGDKNKEKDNAIAIVNIVRSVLSKKNGKLETDPRTNTLIVTDVPEVFPQVEQIIAELDKKAPQILIEAQIVEINTDRMNEMGIEWGGSRGEMAYFAGPARLTDYGLRPGFYSGNEWKQFFPKSPDLVAAAAATPAASTPGVPTAPATEASGGGAGGGGTIDPIFATSQQSSKGVYYGIFSLAQLQAIFRALISKGEGRYLGKPKIVAMNNKTALITISRAAAMGSTSQSSSAGGASGSTSTGVERRTIGLTLKVTPQVNKEGYITMIVQPSYSDLVASAVTIQGNAIFDPVSRGASTMVRVKNGQTVVIGGMLSSTEAKTIKKVPLLGYIPILGWLFTSVSSRRTNTDLVIFITPTILVD